MKFEKLVFEINANENRAYNRITYFFLILFEVFGRDRSWDLCQAHTPLLKKWSGGPQTKGCPLAIYTTYKYYRPNSSPFSAHFDTS